MQKIKKYINFRISVFVALFFAAGIVSAIFLVCKNYLEAVTSLLVTLFIATALCILFRKFELKKIILSVIALSISFMIGFSLIYVQTSAYRRADLGGHIYITEGKIEEVVKTDYGCSALVGDVTIKGVKGGASRYKIALYVYGVSHLAVGDEIVFEAGLVDKGLKYEKRFSAESISNGIKYMATVNAEDLKIIGNSKTIFQEASFAIGNALKEGLGKDEFSVGYALLTGNSDFIYEETLSNFRQAGIAHIFAVSGLHIGFFALALGFVLGKLKINKYVKAVIIVAFCLFYSGMCGFSSSSIRATIMCAVFYLASLNGEKYDGLSSVGIAAVFVLLISPTQLFCVGFQLSFVVVTGIIVLSRPIAAHFSKLPPKISSSLGAVIAAQISGIPISLAAFGEFSLVSIMFNFLFLPLVGVVYILLLLTTTFSVIFGYSSIFLFLSDLCIKAIIFAISILDYKIFIIGGFTLGIFTLFYYAALSTIGGVFNLKILIRRISTVTLAMICVLGTLIYNISENTLTRAYVCGSSDFCATCIISPEGNALIVSHASHLFSVKKVMKLFERIGEDELELVIISGKTYADAHQIITKLSAFSSVNALAVSEDYTGYYNAIKKSFPQIAVKRYNDNEKLPFFDRNLYYNFNGKAVVIDGKNEDVIIFSELGNTFPNKDKKYETVIAYDRAEDLIQYLVKDNIYCYRFISNLYDAESEGTIDFVVDI